MSKFKIGDRVVITGGNNGKVGDEGRVIEETFSGDLLVLCNNYQASKSPSNIKLIQSEQGTQMVSSVVEKLKELGLAPDEKLLRKYGIIDNSGELTEDGKKVVLGIAFNAAKAEIVADLKKLDEQDKK